MNWYTRVVRDLSLLPDFISHYETELQTAKAEVSIRGNVERNMAALPGITESRFAQLQEIEGVLKFLEIQLRRIRSATFKKYLEGYQRALTSRDAERYCEGEADVVDMEALINEVALLRNKYLGVMKALESKNFMLGHMTRLRAAGLEDFTVN
jgi:hypothetical protein